ncbi:MAG: SDR family NAD(P)-dependent oxidoreductase [Anaerolineales bacterium]|jgi:meso-butanediol dehydrogenase/(S,S)-butanediol dehydrogenase/diacetyl reductase
MKGLSGKRTLITGGASGIGKATVQRFLEEGANVTVIDQNPEALELLKQEMPGLSAVIQGDVSEIEAVESAFEQIKAQWGGIDILINNAGISTRHAFLEITPQEWQQMMDVNLTGAFFVAQAAARLMERGVIANMGSTNGLLGYPYYADYNASKAGLIELTRSMALELAPLVRVVAVCPGYVLTPMQEAEYTPEMLVEINSKIPLGRHAKPEEVAALFAFLCSEEAAYITGQAFVIDGGETAGGLASR